MPVNSRPLIGHIYRRKDREITSDKLIGHFINLNTTLVVMKDIQSLTAAKTKHTYLAQGKP